MPKSKTEYEFRTTTRGGVVWSNHGFQSEAQAKLAAVIVVAAMALRGVGVEGRVLEVLRVKRPEGEVAAKRFDPATGEWSARWYVPMDARSSEGGRLAFPIVYSVVGILTKGKEYGEVKRLKRGAFSGAVAIATSQRQKQGYVRSGTHVATMAGKQWAARFDPEVVRAVEAEFERLAALSPKSRRGARR